MTTTVNTAPSNALAAWESVTVLNIDPIASPDTSAALWQAIVAHRSTHDVGAFATTARAIGDASAPSVRDAIERAIAALTALSLAAEPAAQE